MQTLVHLIACRIIMDVLKQQLNLSDEQLDEVCFIEFTKRQRVHGSRVQDPNVALVAIVTSSVCEENSVGSLLQIAHAIEQAQLASHLVRLALPRVRYRLAQNNSGASHSASCLTAMRRRRCSAADQYDGPALQCQRGCHGCPGKCGNDSTRFSIRRVRRGP